MARRRALIRDRFACTVPGCTSCRNIDLHHIVFRSHGGEHTMENLTTVCDLCRVEAHEGLLRIRGRAPDDLVFEFYRAGEDEPHRVRTTSPLRFETPEEQAAEKKSHVGRRPREGRTPTTTTDLVPSTSELRRGDNRIDERSEPQSGVLEPCRSGASVRSRSASGRPREHELVGYRPSRLRARVRRPLRTRYARIGLYLIRCGWSASSPNRRLRSAS